MSDKYDLTKEYWIIRVQEQAEEIKRLTAERDAWRALVLDYNATHGYIDPIEIPTELEQSP